MTQPDLRLKLREADSTAGAAQKVGSLDNASCPAQVRAELKAFEQF
jgi:hypothetical protein